MVSRDGRGVRIRIMAGLALLTAMAIGVAGCGPLTDNAGGDAATDEFTTVSQEGQALESLGFAPADVIPGASEQDAFATPVPHGTDKAGHRPLRRFARLHAFGQHVLHGEVVVQTQNGPKTLVVQRGTVTAVTGTTMTVRSTDGFVLTWTFGDQVKVVINRARAQVGAIAVGAEVGVAGLKDGGQTTARLIVEPKK